MAAQETFRMGEESRSFWKSQICDCSESNQTPKRDLTQYFPYNVRISESSSSIFRKWPSKSVSGVWVKSLLSIIISYEFCFHFPSCLLLFSHVKRLTNNFSFLFTLILILFTVEAKTANHIIQFYQFYHLFLHHEQRPVWIISPLLLIHYPSISAKNQFTD